MGVMGTLAVLIILNQKHFKTNITINPLVLYLLSVVMMNIISKEGNLVLKYFRGNMNLYTPERSDSPSPLPVPMFASSLPVTYEPFSIVYDGYFVLCMLWCSSQYYVHYCTSSYLFLKFM